MNRPEHDAAPAPASSEMDRHLAYGEAAFMLLDALLILVVERKMMKVDDLIVALEMAVSTKRQMAEEGEHPGISAAAAGLITGLANSLATQSEINSPRSASRRD
jgi:hypothetical protein